jgi:uncharacterized delta-60 repeat protein
MVICFVLFAMALAIGAAAGAGGSAPVVVEQTPPPTATRASYGDLVPFGHSRLLALTYTFRRPGHHRDRVLPSSYSVAELTTSGRLVGSFGRDGYTPPLRFRRGTATVARARALARQGRRILLVGERETGRGATAPLLVAYRADGRIDRTFGGDGMIAPPLKVRHAWSKGWHPSRFSDVAVRPAGGIVAVGVIRYGNRQAALVAAYGADGRVDRSFGRNGRVLIPEREDWNYGGFDAVLVLRDGKILLAGPDDRPSGRMKLMRLDADGRRDRTFGDGDGVVTPKDPNQVSCCGESVLLARARHGRILLAGAEGRPGSSVTLLRLHPNGSPDRSFGVAGVARFPSGGPALPGYFTANAMTVRPDGGILVAGNVERVKRRGRYNRLPAVLGYRADGKIDRRFGNRGVEILSRRGWGGLATGVTTNGDGRTFVAGGLYGVGPKGRPLRPFLAEPSDR